MRVSVYGRRVETATREFDAVSISAAVRAFEESTGMEASDVTLPDGQTVDVEGWCPVCGEVVLECEDFGATAAGEVEHGRCRRRLG